VSDDQNHRVRNQKRVEGGNSITIQKSGRGLKLAGRGIQGIHRLYRFDNWGKNLLIPSPKKWGHGGGVKEKRGVGGVISKGGGKPEGDWVQKEAPKTFGARGYPRNCVEE